MPTKQAKLKNLKEKQQGESFWKDASAASLVNKEIKEIEQTLQNFADIKKHLKDLAELLDIAEDEESLQEIEKELSVLSKEVKSFQIQTLFSGKYDNCDAIITLHAGAGGTEAQDWVSMLYRMYTRYCENSRYKISVLDYLDGEEAGIKSVTFLAEGEYAYGYLKAEKGVHRLVRISPFDSNSRRHTSFASVEVLPKVENTEEIEIDDKDLRIDTYRSSGAGGQHVNKTDSAIRITHLPTGTVVACQNERSQTQNRERAMEMLKSKLIELKERERELEVANIKGEIKKIEWGSQIRSYVFMPYTLVKDHRTGYENANISAVMEGDIQPFIEDYLSKAY